MAKGIPIDKLSTAIETELKKYSQEVADQIKQDVQEVAKECVAEIKQKSPKRTGKGGGKYRRGWRAEVVYESNEDIRVIVRNKTAWQLTHLLEFGHAKVKGGRVEGKAHIGPAEQRAKKSLLEKAKVAVRRK